MLCYYSLQGQINLSQMQLEFGNTNKLDIRYLEILNQLLVVWQYLEKMSVKIIRTKQMKKKYCAKLTLLIETSRLGKQSLHRHFSGMQKLFKQSWTEMFSVNQSMVSNSGHLVMNNRTSGHINGIPFGQK